MFKWTPWPLTANCATLRLDLGVHYNILSSKCGSCPTTTTNTTVTCTDVPTDGSVCTFAVETAVCGNITCSEEWEISVINKTLTHKGRYTIKNIAISYVIKFS